MAKFVLTETISQLEYNFEPYAGKGVIPEPSAMQIQNFRQGLAEMVVPEDVTEGKRTDEMPPGEMSRLLAQFLSRDTTEADEKMLHLAADVCSDQPSFDDLCALPFRARTAFVGWLVGTLLVPEVPRPVTSS